MVRGPEQTDQEVTSEREPGILQQKKGTGNEQSSKSGREVKVKGEVG